MLLGFQLPEQSVPITTKVVSLNPTHGEVYSIQPYVNDLWQVGGLGTPVSSANKTDLHNITERCLVYKST